MSGSSAGLSKASLSDSGWKTYGLGFFIAVALVCAGELILVGVRGGFGFATGFTYALYLLAIASLIGVSLFGSIRLLLLLIGKLGRRLSFSRRLSWKLSLIHI